MHRFFINSDLRKGLEIYLKNPTSHQIKNVLRMTEGDQFELFNNSGKSFKAKYIKREDDSVKYYTGIYQSMFPNLDISNYGIASLEQLNTATFEQKMTKQPRPYVVQIGAFGSIHNANRLKLQVTQIGYDVAISKVRTNGKSLNAVRVVRFRSKSSAERVGESIKKKLGIDFRVLYRPVDN